jgi:hypothetical protein
LRTSFFIAAVSRAVGVVFTVGDALTREASGVAALVANPIDNGIEEFQFLLPKSHRSPPCAIACQSRTTAAGLPETK